MSPPTPTRSSRARMAGLALVLAFEGALATADVATTGGLVFTSAYLIAPLVVALFATPRIVAAVGALSFVLAVASGAWNGFLLSGDHLLRCGTVGLAALLAVLSARSRRSALGRVRRPSRRGAPRTPRAGAWTSCSAPWPRPSPSTTSSARRSTPTTRPSACSARRRPTSSPAAARCSARWPSRRSRAASTSTPVTSTGC